MIAPFTNTLIHRLVRLVLYMALIILPVAASAQVDGEPVADTTLTVEADWQSDTTTAVVASPDEVKEPPAAPELRAVPDSAVDKLKADKDFEYANNPSFWKKQEVKEKERKSDNTLDPSNSFFSGDGIRIFFYILIGGLLLWVIYRIVVVNNLFVTRASRTRQVNEEEVEEVLDKSSLEARIKAAIADGNYRAAVRFLFLKTLNGLQDKGWIRHHAQGTNYEYLSQVTPYGVGKEFRFLTHVYEYVWYGEFTLSEEQFKQVHQHFQQFHNSAKL